MPSTDVMPKKRPIAGRCLSACSLVMLLALGCQRSAPAAKAEEPEPESRLHFAPRTELFVEIPPLVVGKPSRLAIHLTRLQGWRALTSGPVVVELGKQRVTVDAPSSPGIFGATLTAAAAGEQELAITVQLDGTPERHDLGLIKVHATDAEASSGRSADHEASPIKFLMEQQWRTDFGLTEVAERPMRPSITFFGSVRGRPDGDVTVRAPLAGQVQIARAGGWFPRMGETVKSGQVLALLQPRFDATIDVGQLARDRARAEATLAYARRDRERQEVLAKEGLANAHDVDLARRDEQIALREMEAARQVMSVSTGGPAAASALPIRAPFDGTLVGIETAPATFAERGGPLFRVADLGRLWIELRVPESERPRVVTTHGASVSVGATTIEVPPDGFIALGAAVDPISRSVPLVFAVPAGGAPLALGGSARARVYTAAPAAAIAVPLAAVVDDQGQSVVFVQVDGESFDRRVVALGPTDGELVAVTSGVTAGERVVSVGAYAVKLAASSGSVPAHGHVH